MHIHKLRGASDAGLIPAGKYFARLAHNLERANADETARRRTLAGEDHNLETLYRRRSAARTH